MQYANLPYCNSLLLTFITRQMHDINYLWISINRNAEGVTSLSIPCIRAGHPSLPSHLLLLSPLPLLNSFENAIVLSYPGISLVPRPLPPPVFDCLQFADMEGEGLENFSRMQTEGSPHGGAVPNKESWSPFLIWSVWGLECRAFTGQHQYFIIHDARDGLTQNRNWHCPLCNSLSSVYPTSPHVIKHSRPFPFVYAYCKWSESGCGDSLGDIARVKYLE